MFQIFYLGKNEHIYYYNVNKEMHEIKQYIFTFQIDQYNFFLLSIICCSPTYVCRVRNSQISGQTGIMHPYFIKFLRLRSHVYVVCKYQFQFFMKNPMFSKQSLLMTCLLLILFAQRVQTRYIKTREKVISTKTKPPSPTYD